MRWLLRSSFSFLFYNKTDNKHFAKFNWQIEISVKQPIQNVFLSHHSKANTTTESTQNF